MKRRRIVLLPALCAVSILVSANCAPQRAPTSTITKPPVSPTATKPSTPAPPMVLRYGLVQIPLGLDVHIYSAPELYILLNNVYETLVYLNEDYRFEPSLAESWDVSTDGRSYTFKLHAGITFHDGTPLDAQAVKENLERIVDPAIRSGKAASLLRGYQGTDVLDRYTVRVRLEKPYAAFLDALAQVYLGIASPTAFKMWGRDDYQKHLVGTGPFKFSAGKYVPGDTIVLEKNHDYAWGPASYRHSGPRYVGSGHNPNSSCQQTHLVYDHTGPAYLDRVIFKSIPDPSARVAALETGAVDAVDGLSLANATRLQKEGKYWITVVPVPESPLLIDQTEGTTNQAERLKLYQVQRRVIEQSLTLPVSDHANINAASRKVNCLTYDVHGWSPYLYDVTSVGLPFLYR